jgi:hypothetical protein
VLNPVLLQWAWMWRLYGGGLGEKADQLSACDGMQHWADGPDGLGGCKAALRDGRAVITVHAPRIQERERIKRVLAAVGADVMNSLDVPGRTDVVTGMAMLQWWHAEFAQ